MILYYTLKYNLSYFLWGVLYASDSKGLLGLLLSFS